jgi:hypothetical protein
VESRRPAPDESEIAELLRRSRPTADPRWVAVTEDRLLPPRPRRSFRLAWRPAPALRLGAAVSVELALLVVALGLAGASPLGGDQPVVARDLCRDVRVLRAERVPRLIQEPGGEARITYETRRVSRVVRRCR